jgi:hypothetical protein
MGIPHLILRLFLNGRHVSGYLNISDTLAWLLWIWIHSFNRIQNGLLDVSFSQCEVDDGAKLIYKIIFEFDRCLLTWPGADPGRRESQSGRVPNHSIQLLI